VSSAVADGASELFENRRFGSFYDAIGPTRAGVREWRMIVAWPRVICGAAAA